MILVFGGTTEGRKAVEALEEAGSRYFYSTRGDGQALDLVNGVHLKGDMRLSDMTAFCHDHDIRLLIDAAHPFAEALHENLISLARQNHPLRPHLSPPHRRHHLVRRLPGRHLSVGKPRHRAAAGTDRSEHHSQTTRILGATRVLVSHPQQATVAGIGSRRALPGRPPGIL